MLERQLQKRIQWYKESGGDVTSFEGNK